MIPNRTERQIRMMLHAVGWKGRAVITRNYYDAEGSDAIEDWQLLCAAGLASCHSNNLPYLFHVTDTGLDLLFGLARHFPEKP